MRMRSKKASLDISINAIVIIVLAMTFLGLGIGFVKNMFSGITETTFTVQDQIKQQILDDLRTGDKKLSFPTTEIQIVHGDAKVLAMGIKNTKVDTLNFKVGLSVPGQTSTIDSGTDYVVTEGTTSRTLGNFIWDSSMQTLATNDASVYPIKFKAGPTSGTFIVKMTVSEYASSTATVATGEYASKSFFITIT